MIELGHLDVNVVTHCNQRCVSCSHVSPFAKAWAMEPDVLMRDLENLGRVAHFQRIQMVGGEPTLHKWLVQLMDIARLSGIANEVSVITNGRLLPKMGDDFWQALDILQLSVYPTLDRSIIDYAKARGKAADRPVYVTEFREFYKQFRREPTDGAHFNSCHWKSDCWTVHDGHFALCPQSLFFPKEFMGLGQFVDCLPLEGVTEEVFLSFINRSEPLNACKICCANEMKLAPWGESKTRDEWLEESTL